MNPKELTRREFLESGKDLAFAAAAGSLGLHSLACDTGKEKPVVSIAKIRNDRIDMAVESAVDLLGGIGTVTKGKERIMLKPNLAGASSEDTTNPVVVETLAKLMQAAGKDVLIGEGSAAADGFNIKDGEPCRTKKREILDPMQQFVFEELGYTALADSLGVPLINLHSGDIVEVEVPDAFVFDKISLHQSVAEIDMLCSVPMMKTHLLAGVSLGMKNLLGLFPGTVYYSLRTSVHEKTSIVDPSGTAAAIVDVVRANPLGLVVIDGSMAMEGQGPSVSVGGKLVKMDVIIAGTNPLATDMVAAHIMGFDPNEISTFRWAQNAGMTPFKLENIETRCDGPIVQQAFAKPDVVPWAAIRNAFGARVI
jgi:uncharacterized protein (DUF362 family)